MIFFSTSENATTWHAQHTVLHKLQLKYDLNTVEPLISDRPECWVLRLVVYEKMYLMLFIKFYYSDVI